MTTKDPGPSQEDWEKHLRENVDELKSLRRTLDNILEIVMSTSESERISKVSKIRKRVKSNKILTSVRKANSE